MQDEPERHDELDAARGRRCTGWSRASAMPTTRPPTTAPSGLSNPPSAAAAKRRRAPCCHEAGVEAGALGGHQRCRPARRVAAASAQPSISMQPGVDADQPAGLGVRGHGPEREAEPGPAAAGSRATGTRATSTMARRDDRPGDRACRRRRDLWSLPEALVGQASASAAGRCRRSSWASELMARNMPERDDDDVERVASPARPAGSAPAR